MSPFGRAAIAALFTLLLGGVLNAIAIRRGWLPRFNWFAAAVTPIAVGLLVFWSAT